MANLSITHFQEMAPHNIFYTASLPVRVLNIYGKTRREIRASTFIYFLLPQGNDRDMQNTFCKMCQ